MNVLVVDDDPELRDLVARALERDGHRVRVVGTVATAHEAIATSPPEVMVLDVALPDGSGFELCRSLRRDRFRFPILLLTALGEVSQRVEGLESGADDFLAKPFAIAELRARVRAVGRRGSSDRVMVIRRGDVEVDFPARRAAKAGLEVPMTRREWSVLEVLASRQGRVASRIEILESAWGEDSDAAAASLEVLVGRIRRKLGAGMIRTVRGEGYALAGE